MTQTYVENRIIPLLPKDYSESALRNRFSARMAMLQTQIDELNEANGELDKINGETDWQGEEGKLYGAQELLKEYIGVYRDRESLQKQYDEIRHENELLDEYGDSFVQLYKIKDDRQKYGSADKISFIEVDVTGNEEIITQDQYFNPDGTIKQLALKVEVADEDVAFNLGFMEYHVPNDDPQIKAQLSFDNSDLEELNKEKLKKIFDYCESLGLSTEDMDVRNFDGSVDEKTIREKINGMLAEIKREKAAEAEENTRKEAEQKQKQRLKNMDTLNAMSAEQKAELSAKTSDISDDAEPEKSQIAELSLAAEDDMSVSQAQHGAADDGTVQQQSQSASVPAAQTAAPANDSPAQRKQKEIEKEFEKWIGTPNGINKKVGASYFKKHTGYFGFGWAVYTIYEGDVTQKQREKEGTIDKDNKITPYSYAIKIFIKMGDNGRLQFSYRTPNNKKVNEDYINGIVGVFKDLGYTQINFPQGIPDVEKGLWRKALAEKGLVPLGISIDRAKAEGMLKAAKEKLSTEDYNKYKFRLAKVLKGKSPSERQYIDGLINSHYFSSFTNSYGEVLKSKIKGILRTKNLENGAVDKIAAFRTLRILFDVYKYAAPHSADRHMIAGNNILSSNLLTNEEKRALQSAGLVGPVDKLNLMQIEHIYDILYARQKQETRNDMYQELIEVRFNTNIGAKRADKIIINDLYKNARNMCEGINEDLQALGVDEIGLIKSFDAAMEYGDFLNNYLPEYRRTHPQNQQQQSQRPAANASEEQTSAQEQDGVVDGETSTEQQSMFVESNISLQHSLQRDR